MLKHITLLFLTIVVATMAVLFTTGCGGGSDAATSDHVVIVPVFQGMVAHSTSSLADFDGPVGRYGFRVTPKIVSSLPVDQYRLYITEVTKMGDLIRVIQPDEEGGYELSPAGYYRGNAHVGMDDSSPHGECWITIDNTPAPAVMIVLPGYVFPDGQSAIPHGTTPDHFTGPAGEYGFTVTTPMGSPTDQSGRQYYLSVEWVDQDGFIGDALVPNEAGKYWLAARRYQVSARVDAPERPGELVAKCWIETSKDFPPPSQ